jgi:NDP-sugar pyrophosphorylase family protein
MTNGFSALIMAGGRSHRMRSVSTAQHKGLRTVAGVPLIEWNLRTLLFFGFLDVHVAISAQEPDLLYWVEEVGRPLAWGADAKLTPIIESQPLGTIGAVRLLTTTFSSVIVVNVDNLTDLDLRSLADFHLERGAAMTVASHEEPIRIPWGRLELSGEMVTACEEKPILRPTVSSGVYLLSALAVAQVRSGVRTDAPELVNSLLGRGHTVAAYRHQAHWIDINDEAALARAEALISQQGGAWPGAVRKAVATE